MSGSLYLGPVAQRRPAAAAGAAARVAWLDTARAIAIVAVVAGHVTSDRAIWAALFHFHVPLFFMLSGMAFTPAPPEVIAAKRARTLLLPYAAWLAIVALLDAALAVASGEAAYLPWDRPAVAVARLVLGGTFLVGPFGIFWFVTCLFLVQLAGAAILRRPARVVVLAMAAAFVAAHLVPGLPGPWGVTAVPLALFFFLAGALWRRRGVGLGWWPALAGLLAAVTLPLDLKLGAIGTPGLSIVAALGLCHAILLAAQRLPRSALVTTIGQASLVVMYLHLTLFYALRGLLPEGAVAALGVTGPVMVWIALRRFAVTRRVLLGTG